MLLKANVILVGMTTPSAMTGCFTANQLIAYAARVSNPSNQINDETAPKLLKYLIKMEITTTRDISRQILRHRSFSFQEFSQRYAKSSNFIDREARLQDNKNRQNSVVTDDRDLKENWNMKQHEVIRKANEVYEWALENGIAKEQARVVLPEGNTETTLYMAGTLRSWIHYYQLRSKNGTQKEHSDIAIKCWDIIKQHFPDVAEAVEELQ